MAHDASASMSRAEILPVCGLALAAFVFNSSEFMPIGLLTDIGSSFGTSEATTGLMISIYAWAVAALSLPLMLLGSRVPPRRLIVVVVAVFAVGQLCSALAPTFVLLICARLIVACAHAVFWSIASPFAVRVVRDEHGATAMSMIVTGTSIAMIFGLPLGRIVGLVVGWRMTFGIIAAISAGIVFYLLAAFPQVEHGESFQLSQLPSLFANRVLVAIYLMTVLLASAYYVGYSYIEPFLAQVAGMPDGLITAALMAFGAAGMVGSVLFSRLYDRHSAPFLAVFTACLPLSLLLMGPATISPAVVFGVCVLWGTAATAFNVACQAEIISVTSTEASAVAMSIFSGIFNLGIGLGSWIGGRVVDGVGIALIGFVGAAIGAVGLAICLFALVPLMTKASRW